MRSSVTLASFVASALVARMAIAGDSAGALDELKRGYNLKQAGNCREALPHFTRSVELDAKPKALLNLADCEQQLGDLVAAQNHASQGRHLAQQQNDAELAGVADEQLAAIDKRLPRLTIRLETGAPTGTNVSRDGALVASTSLGVHAPVNPGKHTIVAFAPGYLDRRFEVTLAEGAREQVDVKPGAPLALAQPESPQGSHPQTADVLMYSAFGVGAVGLTVGIVAGLAAGSKHDTLVGECPSNGCPSSAQGDLDGFHSLKTVSTVGYVVGAVGVASGVALWLWLPRDRSSGPAAYLWVRPSLAGVGGVF